MAGAHSRRKQPELVRRALLDETVKIASEHGVAAVTIEAVAKAAGVTKGGLFHHFPSKQALIDGVLAEMMEDFQEQLDALIAADPEPAGRFTRAYIEAVFADLDKADSRPWAALAVSMITDPTTRAVWSNWFMDYIGRHRADESSIDLTMARLAADGAWYAVVLGIEDRAGPRRDELKARLVAMTRPA